jgi:hypothetical protein
MAKHNCDNCKFRAKHDQNPSSLMSRLWRWHTNWCPGWKRYMNSLEDEKRNMIAKNYSLQKWQR